MLFHLSFRHVDSSESGAKRSAALFSGWKPPAGAQFIGFYGFADSSGGVAIVEVDSTTTLAKITAPFVPWLVFTATPILPIEDLHSEGRSAIEMRSKIG